MSIKKYADSTGLTEFWSKVKSHVATAISGKQDTLVSGTNIKTVNNNSLLGSGDISISGGSKNIWYGICDTAAATQAKVVTTSSGDFALTTGNMVRVKMTNAQTYSGTATLNVDNKGAVNITRVGTNVTTIYFWVDGEIVDFVYDGTNFVMSNKGVATTTYYGMTKLSSSTSSTSTALAATPSAVKAAYDLATSKPTVTASTTDITAGTTALTTGDLYLVYE